MKLSEWKLYSIYALGHILQGSPEADEKYLKILFKYLMGKECNFDNPQTYSEKLQWLKIYDRNPLYTQLVDKYEVRKFIEERIGSEHLIPCLGVWNHFDEIDFNKLPNQFVLKCTHDSGGLIICKDKSTLDLKQARKKIEHCLKRNYFLNHREWPYKDVKPRIIAEEYTVDESGYELKDYKIFCFNGEPKAMFIATDRGTDTKFDFFDQENSGCGRIRLDQSSQYARSNHSAKAVRYGAGSFEAGHLRIERPADCKSIFGHRSLRRLWTEHGTAYRIKKRKEIYLSALRHKPQRSGLFLASYQRK